MLRTTILVTLFYFNFKSQQILVLILNHIRSTVDQIGAVIFLKIGTGPTVPVISVCSMSSLTLARHYQYG